MVQGGKLMIKATHVHGNHLEFLADTIEELESLASILIHNKNDVDRFVFIHKSSTCIGSIQVYLRGLPKWSESPAVLWAKKMIGIVSLTHVRHE